MATFAYVGRSRSGAVKKGELSAKTRDEAVDQLRKQSVVVTSLEEKKSGAGGFKLSFGSGLTDKDLSCIYATIRYDDQCRSTFGAVSRNPLDPVRE